MPTRRRGDLPRENAQRRRNGKKGQRQRSGVFCQERQRRGSMVKEQQWGAASTAVEAQTTRQMSKPVPATQVRKLAHTNRQRVQNRREG